MSEEITAADVAEEADDMLLNAEMRIGGAVGVGTDVAFAYLVGRGFVGPSGCLSARGLTRARALKRERWGEQ